MAYAMEDVICIGDSLTQGSYAAEDMGPSAKQNYPFYLSRMLDTQVINAGVAGYSASDWYEEKIGGYDFADYKTAIIWLGTNEGYTDTLDTDVEPFDRYEDYALSETGYYCKIIERIKEANPDCLIVLMNVFASKGDVELSNQVIDKIAARYDLHVVDTESLGMENTALHAGLTNPHFGKAGNIAVAELIIRDVGGWLAEAPLRCEFGVELSE